MKKISNLWNLAVATAVLLAAVAGGACESRYTYDTENAAPYIKIGRTAVNFDETADEMQIEVKCSVAWSIDHPEEQWIEVTKMSGAVRIAVQNNDERNVRRTSFRIVPEGAAEPQTVSVAQLGWGKAILLSAGESMRLPAVGTSFDVEVTANVEYEVSVAFPDAQQSDWLTIADNVNTRAEHPQVTTVESFRTISNSDEYARNARITFYDPEPDSEIGEVVLSVVQAGLSGYTAAGGIGDDIKVLPSGGYASVLPYSDPSQTFEKSYDGDNSTIYHSKWVKFSEGATADLVYFFPAGTNIDYAIYQPRTSGGINGNIGRVDVYVQHHGSDDWDEPLELDFNESSSASRIPFSNGTDVKAVKFTVKSGHGDNNPNGDYVAVAEMSFYLKDMAKFEFSDLFEDSVCSKLRDDITLEQIEECPSAFFKNLAYYMYNDQYSTEFRVDEFKPYPKPEEDGNRNKTNYYSFLDNPTGISVQQNDVLVVIADLQGNNGVSLFVRNLDIPGGNGYLTGDYYALGDGVNSFTVKNKGLVYVIHNVSTASNSYEIPESVKPVRLHFASGAVNGYYDIAKHGPESDNPKDWKELLANATDKYFDVLGHYAHLTFPTVRFRENTGDMDALIGAYDRLVYNEQLLLGLEKYNRMFRNRMHFNVMYTSYMNATNYRTSYNDTTLSELCNENNFRVGVNGSVWGPAHEVGHCNQTTGLKWKGLTEVTNNIMSEYIQTTVFQHASRLQRENLAGNVNRYTKAWNEIIVPGRPHVGTVTPATRSQESTVSGVDVFCKLVPFWQLQLYFGNVLGMTPEQQEDKGGFYPDVYQYMRENAAGTNGEQQVNFVYVASLKSGYDLTEFFEKWGFLSEVAVTIDDYGQGDVVVTAAMVTDVKNRIKQISGLKSLNDVPIEYITDDNCIFFKEQRAIVQGTAARTSSTIKFTGWQNVVAYEVYDTSGSLIYVCDGKTQGGNGELLPEITLNRSWENGFTVKAVQYDGSRVSVTL